jgi:hypothetical protein
MKNLIIDSRIRNIELEFLSKYFNVIKLPLSEDVYEEISGHSDIFYTKINDKIIAAPNAKYLVSDFKIGNAKVQKDYPNDVKYNICQIGNKIIGSKYVDTSIKPDIIVKQGYVKCSISVIDNKYCITTDKKISKVLTENNIDNIYIQENNIRLLKKDSSISYMRGFIGGASISFDNKFVLFGDIEKLESKDIIIDYLNSRNIELICFKGLDVYDYGGGIIY